MKVFSALAAKRRKTHRSGSADFTSYPAGTVPAKDSTAAKSVDTPTVHNDANLGHLPVVGYRAEIVRSVLENPENKVLLVQSETGSGKSTLIPSFFLDSNAKMVVTQPRRVAAVTLAHRVSSQQNLAIGQRIGYRVRFDDRTSGGSTQLVYATDGMLLREAMADPLLSNYSIIFLDEAHERSLQTDILMGVVQRARLQRKQKRPLRVVVMSATLQIDTFIAFFGKDKTNVIQIPGRQFPVDILYTEQDPDDYSDAALSTIAQIHEHNPMASGDDSSKNGKGATPKGDILVFLPGQDEIEDLAIMLKQYLLTIEETEAKDSAKLWTGDRVEAMNPKLDASSAVVAGVLVCVLYAALPPEAQLAVFADRPPGCIRKVILSTNIAETSVTLPDVKYVIDTGKYKSREASSTTGMESLTVQNVSQAQAAQRAGRAGRVRPGICFRLYTEAFYDALSPTSIPEILRVNLSQVVLQLKGMGVVDPTKFEFVTQPDRHALIRATKVLFALSALDDKMQLTDYGRKLAKLPLDPIFGNLLLRSGEYKCTKEMLTSVSLLSSDNLFYRPSGEGGLASKAAAAHRRFLSHEGDLPTYLNVYRAWQQEAVFVPASSGGRKAQKRQRKRLEQLQKQKGGSGKVLLHGEWCKQNFVSARALSRAFEIRSQLNRICQQDLKIDVGASHGDDLERYCKCIASGLFLQAASRSKQENAGDKRSGNVVSFRGRFQTKVGNTQVSVHPTSAMFGRNPAPACIVYTELVVTKKTYIRGVTQIREEWLNEVAPNFFSSVERTT